MPPTDPTIDHFDRLPGETSRQYSAYLTYRNQGPDRSFDKAYRQHKGVDGAASKSKKTRAAGFWNRWAAMNRWHERAEAYDDLTAKQAIEADLQRTRELARGRVDLEFEQQARLKEVIDRAWSQLDKYWPLPATTIKRVSKVEAVRAEDGQMVPGRVDTTIVQGMRPESLARFLEAVLELISAGVNGHVRKSLSGKLPDPQLPLGQPSSIMFVEGE